MPDLQSPRKPPNRLWLYGPYVALAIVVAAWTVAWVAIRQQAISAMDQAAGRLRAQGWTIAWSQRTVEGYPFRLLVRLGQPRIAEPSGWSLAAPALEAEAYAYAPGNWVILAPQGVTLTRPFGGAAAIGGQVLKAGFTHLDGQALPQIGIEGRGLSLQPAPGAQALPITSAGRFAFYLRPLPNDAAEFQLQLGQATPTATALLARLSGERPLDLVWDESVTHVSQLTGRDWPSAVRRWSQAGGGVSLDHGEVDAGDVKVDALSGQSAVDADGHLAGDLLLDFSHAGGATQRLAGGGLGGLAGALARTDLTFSGGKIRLGPFVIGKAPRVY